MHFTNSRTLESHGIARVYALAIISSLLLSIPASAQWTGRDGWVEEPATKSLNVEGPRGHAYLDPSSAHREADGLVYFNESSDVMQPEDVGKTGFMRDAYDCARNVKYMCVEHGNWRIDPQSAIDAAKDPALSVYRKYLCNDPGVARGDAGQTK